MTGQWRRSLKRNVGTSGECGEVRDQTRSVILTSQMPVARWHGQIGDPTVADGTSTGSCITLTIFDQQWIGARTRPWHEG
jgi:hypothetical protein